MSCRVSVELMSSRLDGVLSPPDAARLEAHLRTCPACAAQWAALCEADMLLRVAARRQVAPPAYFQARVMQRVALTAVARPPLWERERLQVQGGRPTVKLHPTGLIGGHQVPVPAAMGGSQGGDPARGGSAGFLQHFHPLRNARMGLYLGGMGVAGALSMLLLVLFTALWTTGSAPPPAAVQAFVAGNASVAVAHDWVAILWSLLSDLLGQIDPWLAATGTLIVASLGMLWWRIVLLFARRAGHREVVA